jgi:hypothetical protein
VKTDQTSTPKDQKLQITDLTENPSLKNYSQESLNINSSSFSSSHSPSTHTTILFPTGVEEPPDSGQNSNQLEVEVDEEKVEQLKLMGYI